MRLEYLGIHLWNSVSGDFIDDTVEVALRGNGKDTQQDF